MSASKAAMLDTVQANTDIPERARLIAEATYWAHWVSCWAKRHEIDGRPRDRGECYALKTQAFAWLASEMEQMKAELVGSSIVDIGEARGAPGADAGITLPTLTWLPERDISQDAPGDRPPEQSDGRAAGVSMNPLSKSPALKALAEQLERKALAETPGCPIHQSIFEDGAWFDESHYVEELAEHVLEMPREADDALKASVDGYRQAGCSCAGSAGLVEDIRAALVHANGLYFLDVGRFLTEAYLPPEEILSLGNGDREAVDFSFHLPFLRGRCASLPDPTALPQANHAMNTVGARHGGRFRFGRPITDEEAENRPERDALRTLRRLLKWFTDLGHPDRW